MLHWSLNINYKQVIKFVIIKISHSSASRCFFYSSNQYKQQGIEQVRPISYVTKKSPK